MVNNKTQDECHKEWIKFCQKLTRLIETLRLMKEYPNGGYICGMSGSKLPYHYNKFYYENNFYRR